MSCIITPAPQNCFFLCCDTQEKRFNCSKIAIHYAFSHNCSIQLKSDCSDSVCCVVARWCVVNDAELKKCQELAEATRTHAVTGRNTTLGAYTYQYTDMPTLSCVKADDQYECMQMIFNADADLIQLETGLSYTAGEYYNMMPLVAEKYVAGL